MPQKKKKVTHTNICKIRDKYKIITLPVINSNKIAPILHQSVDGEVSNTPLTSEAI